MSRAEYGADSPVTIERGTLSCEPVNEVVLNAGSAGVWPLLCD